MADGNLSGCCRKKLPEWQFFSGGETVGPNGGTRLQRKCARPPAAASPTAVV